MDHSIIGCRHGFALRAGNAVASWQRFPVVATEPKKEIPVKPKATHWRTYWIEHMVALPHRLVVSAGPHITLSLALWVRPGSCPRGKTLPMVSRLFARYATTHQANISLIFPRIIHCFVLYGRMDAPEWCLEADQKAELTASELIRWLRLHPQHKDPTWNR